MPTPFGHALAGVAVAWLSDLVPPRARRPGLALTCAAVAVLPDVDLLLPATHRAATHSIGAAAAVTIIAAGVTGWVKVRARQGRGSRAEGGDGVGSRQGTGLRAEGSAPTGVWRVALACGAAYASHILLDWLGVDRSPPLGIQALWPLTHAWYLSGADLFAPTERRHLFTLATWVVNLKAAGIEALVIGPLLAALWLVRVKTAPRLAAQMAGRDHPTQ